MKEEIKKCIEETINKNSLVQIHNNLYLKKYQMEILDYYHVEYQKCSSVREVLLLIEEVLDTEEPDNDALEEVACDLQEFQYYHYTNK